jgi:vacuolar protein sorting-associated protein 29
MLVPGKMQHVICTGNVGNEQYEELRDLAPNLHVVAGDYDVPGQFAEDRIVRVGDFRIGVLHGHQIIPYKSKDALNRMRRKMHCDILISGHTHSNMVEEMDGCYHINPGSITGAYSSITPNVTPSFVLLAIQGPKVVCYVYELIDGDVEVSKTEFMKQVSSKGSAQLGNLLL